MDFGVWFWRLTDLSSVSQSEEALKEALTGLVGELGFDRYAYLYVQPKLTRAISNYELAWQKRYFDARFAEIDPVVKTARAKLRAFTWSLEASRRSSSSELRRFYSEAAEFGICSGVSIPIRTACRHMSMLTLASHKPSLTLKKDIDPVAAATAVAFLHAKITQLHAHPTAGETTDLRPMQASCLKWSSQGMTMAEIAEIENISFSTANFHLNNARKALDARSLQQATATAAKLGLI